MMAMGNRALVLAIFFSGVLFFSFLGSALADFSDFSNTFGESSYERQQRQAQKGFEDFDAEFDDESKKVEPKKESPAKAIKPRTVVVVVPIAAPNPIPDVPRDEPKKEKTKPKPKPALPSKQVMNASGLTVELKGCQKGEKALDCSFMITSNNFDRSVFWRISDGNRLFDDVGNEYRVQSITVGRMSRTWDYLKPTLISGVPTKAAWRFTNISSEASSIAVLQMKGSSSGGQGSGDFDLKFRNVAIE